MFKDVAQIIEVVYRVMPYSNQIRNLKIEDGFILFNWRDGNYKVFISGDVRFIRNEVIGTSSDSSILLEELIKIYFNNAKINETGD